MNILIVNCYHDSNKGDAAIILGTIRLIRLRWPSARITIMSRYCAQDRRFDDAHRHITSIDGSIDIIPSPFPSSSYAGQGRYWGVLSFILLHVPFIAKRVNYLKKSFDIISNASMVISIGGHYLFNKRVHPRDLERLCRFCVPNFIAALCYVPNVLLGHSLGPFKGYLGSYVAKRLTASVTQIWLREMLSAKHLPWLSFGEKLNVMPDCAFALQREATILDNTILGKFNLLTTKYWVVTVRHWGTVEDEEIYIHQIANFLERAYDAGKFETVVLVAQCHGPDKAEDDRNVSVRLSGLLKCVNATLVLDDLSPLDLIKLFSKANLIIGTRFHSIIFALLSGVRPIALSYFGPKANGIMKLLDMDEFCIGYHDVTSDRLAYLSNKILSDDMRYNIIERIDMMQNELLRVVTKLPEIH